MHRHSDRGQLGLADLLDRLDGTSSLKQTTKLYQQGETFHFTTFCDVVHASTDLLFPQTEEILETVLSGKLCNACWTEAPEDWTTGRSTVTAMAVVYRLEQTLDTAEGSAAAESLALAVEVLNALRSVANPSVNSWKESVRQQASNLYTRLLPEATNDHAKAVSKNVAANYNPNADSTAEVLVILYNSYNLHDPSTRTLSIPYLIAARKGQLLLKAPISVAEALRAGAPAADLDDWEARWGPAPFQVAPLTAPQTLPQIVEMWDPEDPLFGDLEKLVEAARLIC